MLRAIHAGAGEFLKMFLYSLAKVDSPPLVTLQHIFPEAVQQKWKLENNALGFCDSLYNAQRGVCDRGGPYDS